MSNLMPEKRLDKNGVLTTKHVRVSSDPAPSRVLPAPALKTGKQNTGPKLTAKQKTPRTTELRLNYHEADAELTDRLAPDGEHYGKTYVVTYRLNASDAEFYDVHSVASLGNTATLLKAGVRSKEEALKLFKDLHLDRLQEFNTDFTRAMLEKRVTMEKYWDFTNQHGFTPGTEPDHYADAADIYSIKAYRKVSSDFGINVVEDLLDGKYTAADLKKIGAERLNKAMQPEVIIKALVAIKDGTADYDATQLAAFLDRTGKELNYSVGMELANTYGMEFISGMSSMWQTYSVSGVITDLPVETRREILTYANEIAVLDTPQAHGMTPNDIVALYHGGVNPKTALDQWNSGELTAQQIVAVHQEGVAPSIASGWL